jgi:C-terminal processing protease CtpA/Prc
MYMGCADSAYAAVVSLQVRFGGGVDGEWQVGHLDPEAFPSLPGTLTTRPLVVLTNASTASASEMLAGALADNGRCVALHFFNSF